MANSSYVVYIVYWCVCGGRFLWRCVLRGIFCIARGGVFVIRRGGSGFVDCVFYVRCGCCCVSCDMWGEVVGMGIC